MVQKIQIKVLLLLFFVFFLNNIILFILKVNKKSKLHLFDIGKLNSTKLKIDDLKEFLEEINKR